MQIGDPFLYNTFSSVPAYFQCLVCVTESESYLIKNAVYKNNY